MFAPLALGPAIWQGAKMNKRRNAAAGGFFIAFGTLAGVIAGIKYHQLAIGMFGGFAAGVGLALLIWLFDRMRD